MADERFILTRAGYGRIVEEIARLEQEQTTRREQLGEVDEDTGNLEGEEAGAFFEAKTQLERIDERLGHLRFVLEHAAVRAEDPDPKRIDPGERVVVWDFTDRRERTFDILSAPEVQTSYTRDDGGSDVSVDSPVGKALLGRQVGDVVEVETPDGAARYAVRRIDSIPD